MKKYYIFPIVISFFTLVFMGPLFVYAAVATLPDGTLIRAEDDYKVHVVFNGKKRWIKNIDIFNSYNFKWKDIKVVNPAVVKRMEASNLMRESGDVKVYVINEFGYKRHIINPSVFKSYNFDWNDIVTVSSEEIADYPESYLIRKAGDPKVYYLGEGNKRWIESPESFYTHNLKWEEIHTVNDADIDSYEKGEGVAPESKIKQPSGTIPATPATPAVPTEPKSTEPVPTEPATPAIPAVPPTKEAQDTTAPVVSDIQVTAVTINSATISWTTDEPTTPKLEYSTNNSLESAIVISSSSFLTSHIYTLAALTENTVYYYRITAEDAAGNKTSSSLQNFTTAQSVTGGVVPPAPVPVKDTTAPLISNVLVSSITANSAVISWTTDEPADSQIDYGLTKTYAGSTILDTGLVTSHSQGVSGLEPSTKYFFKVKSRDASGNLRDAEDFDFTTTDAADTIAPLISNISVSNITETSVTISWTTSESSDTQIEYGLNTSYGNLTSLDTALTISHSQFINSLSASTIYHYRVISKDASGNKVVSSDFTFTTATPPADTVSPVISNVQATNISTDSATITWSTDEAADTRVEYGLTTSYGSLTAIDTSLITSHSQVLNGLQSLTIYHYRVKSKDVSGNESVSTDRTFTTQASASPDTTSPIISNVRVASTDHVSATITWITDEPSDSQLEYGLTATFGNFTTLDTNLVTSHSHVISALVPNTTYYYRVRSKDASDNLTTAATGTFLTDSVPALYNDVLHIYSFGVYPRINGLVTFYWYTGNPQFLDPPPVLADGQVEYGTTALFGNESPLDTTLVSSHIFRISGLELGTSYYYRDKSTDANGNSVISPTTIIAIREDTASPIIFDIEFPIITNSGILITWKTDEVSEAQIEYGTTAAYGSSTSKSFFWNSPIDMDFKNLHSQSLPGLLGATIYHFRVKATDPSGNVSYSEDGTFTTLPTNSNFKASNIASSSALITWTTDVPTDSQVVYGLTTSYGSETTLDPSFVTSHSVTISGLQPNTQYWFGVKSKDPAGNLATPPEAGAFWTSL